MSPQTIALLLSILKLLVAWVLFAAFAWGVIGVTGKLSGQVQARVRLAGGTTRYRGLFQLLGRQVSALLRGLLRLLALLLVLVVASSLLTFSFSLFQATSGISQSLLQYLGVAADRLILGFVGYLPNLAVLIVVAVVAFYAIKLMGVVFRGIEEGLVVIRGFQREWAEPTKNLLAVLVIAVALVVMFPYLPGGDSPAFRGISIFIGVLLSLGSGSAMGNVIAGVILTYMMPYRVGDRVQIGDAVGDVKLRNLLVTRLLTIKNVEVIVPNAMVLANHIVNYSSLAQTTGLILHTKVTIGYDAPWRRVHELLFEAAFKTADVLREPAPFVLQTSLDDSYVSYEINAYTKAPHRMAIIYSELHANIQDGFNAAGVEIMSPAYQALRDGNVTTIPEDARPAAYRAPGFRVGPVDEPR